MSDTAQAKKRLSKAAKEIHAAGHARWGYTCQEALAAIERLEAERGQGHDEPCYYCGEPCNSLHGNPSLWPVCLAQEGTPRWHHVGCVLKKIREADSLRAENEGLRKDRNSLLRSEHRDLSRLRAERDEAVRLLKGAIAFEVIDRPTVETFLAKLEHKEAGADDT